MSCIEFTVNGKKCSVDPVVPMDTSLNAYLRYYLALPGTKAMCHQGGCGACIVAVRAYNQTSERFETFSVNSCLVLVFTCQGWDITTIEGLGSRNVGYHAIQSRTAKFNATQCGYCTPGWEMQLYSFLDKNMTMAEMEDSFDSNTCRCTGYRPILDTVKSFAIDANVELCQKVKDIEDLCGCKDTQVCERKSSTCSDDGDWTVVNELAIPSICNEVIEMNFGGDKSKEQKYFKVHTELQIFQMLSQVDLDSYMLLDGNTARGIWGIHYMPQYIIDICGVKSLKQYRYDQNLVLGANITIQDCISLFNIVAKSRAEFAYLKELVKHLLLVANVAIRKLASLAGNIVIKHKDPENQSDIFVLFETVGATVTIKDMFGKKKELSMSEFLKYNIRGVLIVSFNLPPFGRTHVFRSYKILPRSHNAVAIVNAGFLLNINENSIVESASIVYGNISKSFVHAVKTEKYLVGKNIFNNSVLQGAINLLDAEVIPAFDPAKPSPDCRKKLAIGLFYKFILNISPKGYPLSSLRSGGSLLERPLSSGKQKFQTDPSLYPLTQPLEKYEGLIQSSGEAQYVNDLLPMKNEVFGAFVLSTVHCAELHNIDASEALKMEGVLTMYTAKDFPGINSFDLPNSPLHVEIEEIVASKNIKFHGQPVAIIVADSEALAAKAATKVKVTYKNISNIPPVLTIDEAKKDSKRLIATDNKIEPKGRGTNTTKVIKGVYEIGGQYHFYLEPLSCVVIPVDRGLEVYDSSQWIDVSHTAIARCLNMKQSEIFMKLRRVGGGFGGKVTRNAQVATACALVAKKMDRPCRFILPLTTNMIIAGGRLPTQCEYEVGVDDNGKIQYLDASLIEDMGCSRNDNMMGWTITPFGNCYKTDYFSLKTSIVLTDLASNTSFRAPGTAEAISSIEHIMEHIAFEIKKDPTDVRLANMRTEDNDLPELIETLKKKVEYDRRYNEIQQFNKANRWVKKAIRINVMSFPVVFYGNYTAIVSIYKGDGSVTVTTGGIEMGQGSNTKVRQIVAHELGIPIDLVEVLPFFSFVAANNMYSGGSITSQCAGYAAIKACKTLKSRLQPIKNSLTNPTWLELIQKAGELYVDLVAEYMMTDKDPDLANYSAFAVAILEGELDVLTGKYMLNRVDILEDVGMSINPEVDIGQIEGAYVQGISYFTSEKMVYDKKTGKLLSDDCLNYFVNVAKDIPVQMNVMLREDSRNKKGVLGTKGVGEMGICTANGVTHVLRDCIMESRKDSGYDPCEWINIDIPCTTESILKALNVKPCELVLTK